MHDLSRFVEAQDRVIAQVRAELAAGRKRSHWMWFVFPQLDGLARSETARFYALHSLAEARAWLAHPILGPRLLDCTRLVNQVEGRAIRDILGTPDDLKFRSCMTLFAAADPAEAAFRLALAKYHGGAPDPETIRLLG